MEPDEITKAWQAQDNQSIFNINPQKMEVLVAAKKKQSAHITHVSEWLLIAVNTASGLTILLLNKSKGVSHLLLLILGIWMIGCALMLCFARWKRLRANSRFNRSVQGELQEALSNAEYQLRLSKVMRWNTLIIALLVIAAIGFSGKPLWIAIVFAACFILPAYISRWEHGWYSRRVEKLKALQEELKEV